MGSRRSLRAGLTLPVAVLAAALALIAVAWAAVLTQSRFERTQAMENAAERAGNLATTFEEYALRTIEGADSITQFVGREFAVHGADLDLAGLVAALDIDTAAYDAISIVDGDGSVRVAASVPPPDGPINIADREHFFVHRDRDLGRVFVGKPVLSRRSGQQMVPVTRRLNGPDGRFAGIVSVQFDPARFTSFYEDATVRPLDVLSLVGRDGITRARRIGDRLSTGEDIARSQLLAEWAVRGRGTFVGPGGLDGVERLYGFRSVEPYDMVATVGLPVHDIFAEATARERFYTRSAAIVTAAVLISAVLLVAAIVRRRQLFDRLAASNERFKGIFDHARDAMLLADDEARYIDANPGACAMLGYGREELVGLSLADITTPGASSAATEQWRAFATAGQMSGEIQLRRKDGTLVDAEYSAVAHIEPGVHLSVMRDVTARHLAEQRALRTQRMESLGTLAGGIAHDLNNALTPVLLSVEILRDGEADAYRRSLLGTIEDSAQRSADLVRQVLSFARGVDGERLDLDIAQVLRDAERHIKETFPAQVTTRVVSAPGLWRVLADPAQLHQVLLNLCLNAREAMPDGGEITLSADNVDVDDRSADRDPDAAPGAYVRISVEDTGHGIPPDIAGRVFDPFFTTKAFGHGTGLGLPTALAIVKSHGGFMRLDSEPARQTRVDVYLPAGHDQAGMLAFEA